MSATARGSRSTNVTCAAPRLSASMPTAPGPGKAVEHRAPRRSAAPSTLNSVSRSLSDVGRSPSQSASSGGPSRCRQRPLQRQPSARSNGVSASGSLRSSQCPFSSDPPVCVCQPTPTSPNRCSQLVRRTRPAPPPAARIVERGDGFAPRVFHQLVIAQQVADAQRRHARTGACRRSRPGRAAARSRSAISKPSVVSVSAFSRSRPCSVSGD